ncbi:Xylanase inhibitor protein 2 [Dichanthelium oligosanthes]|uniref:Xylanase inhibitor protein 2 n=1 Tax=Dichanthelium oligosanthes TaxID=888268 RepID=A0A1E5UMT3_9POAL|nr:Xylanase inhibitor protein 2 [Dichanthelium oligosanthes]
MATATTSSTASPRASSCSSPSAGQAARTTRSPPPRHQATRPGGVTLTATVRCRYPDSSLTPALATGLFASIHIRLYGDLKCTWGNMEAWEKWAAAYPESRVFVGVVASPEADEDAYMFQKDLYYSVLQFAEKVRKYIRRHHDLGPVAEPGYRSWVFLFLKPIFSS